MLQSRWGVVAEILAVRVCGRGAGRSPGAVELRVEFLDAPAESGRALAYPELTGPLQAGDRVLVNTTAVRLGLGTGGLHFVMAAEGPAAPSAPSRTRGGDDSLRHTPMPDDSPLRPRVPCTPPRAGGQGGEPDGHIVKLRYTPLQHTVRTVEEGPAGTEVDALKDLGGMPVVAAELHSQVAAIAAGVRAGAPGARVVYIMPDTAALPLALSRLVPRLLDAGLLQETITCGQAFGGGLEAVSVPSALAIARAVAGADVVIVAQGPGNAGTGTRLGFSGIAQADWLNAAAALGGTPIAAVRLSLADPRPRHRGVSHHTLTVLGRLALCRAVVPLPELPPDAAAAVAGQVAPLREKHSFETRDGAPALELLARLGIAPTTMGRGMEEERAFFLAAGAAGAAAASRLADGEGLLSAPSAGS